MNSNIKASTVAAIATVVSLAIAGQAWEALDAVETDSVGGSTPGVAFITQVQTTTIPVDRILTAVQGLDPVACRLSSQTLENRWGSGGIAPRWGLPGDGGPEVADVVRRALRGEVTTADTERLLDALGAADDCVRKVAAQLLGRARVDGLPDRVAGLLSSGDARARVGAALALGYGEWRDQVGALASALDGSDEGLRSTAAWALGRTESRDAIAPLTAALEDGSVAVRANAAVALGWIESGVAIEPLAAALEDPVVDIRVNAAWALGQIERPEAIPALTAVLASDQDAQVRRAAAWALGRIE